MPDRGDHELYVHWLLFQVECLKRSGSAFQAFFEDIMRKAHDSFTAVKPWGNEGDRKCDGLLLGDGVMFQVYAPETLNAASTLSKIAEDFAGVKAQWKSLRKWVFVTRHPLPPAVVQALVDPEANEGAAGITIESWDVERLWDEVKALSLQDRVELLGPVPIVDGSVPLLQAPISRMDELDIEAFGVDAVDPGILRQAVATEGNQLTYVSRGAVDGRLREALRSAIDGSGPPLVCVYGGSKSGKTRTMLEALRSELPEAIVISPEPGRENVQSVLAHRVVERAASSGGAAIVLWLDDLEPFVRVDGVGIGCHRSRRSRLRCQTL